MMPPNWSNQLKVSPQSSPSVFLSKQDREEEQRTDEDWSVKGKTTTTHIKIINRSSDVPGLPWRLLTVTLTPAGLNTHFKIS